MEKMDNDLEGLTENVAADEQNVERVENDFQETGDRNGDEDNEPMEKMDEDIQEPLEREFVDDDEEALDVDDEPILMV